MVQTLGRNHQWRRIENGYFWMILNIFWWFWMILNSSRLFWMISDLEFWTTLFTSSEPGGTNSRTAKVLPIFFGCPKPLSTKNCAFCGPLGETKAFLHININKYNQNSLVMARIPQNNPGMVIHTYIYIYTYIYIHINVNTNAHTHT